MISPWRGSLVAAARCPAAWAAKIERSMEPGSVSSAASWQARTTVIAVGSPRPTSSTASTCRRRHISASWSASVRHSSSAAVIACSTRPRRTCLCSADRTSSLGSPCSVVRPANGSCVHGGIGRCPGRRRVAHRGLGAVAHEVAPTSGRASTTPDTHRFITTPSATSAAGHLATSPATISVTSILPSAAPRQ